MASRRPSDRPRGEAAAVARRGERQPRDLRAAILDATRRLLAERRFDEISVADILAGAGVSRGSFYFYFGGKHDVLAELVRQATRRGHDAAQPWPADEDADERRAALRAGIAAAARLWREQAPVLRAIVENWRSDAQLTELWLEQMSGFTAATLERIGPDHRDALTCVRNADTDTLASALAWLGERLYYLAAIGVPPFDDERALVEVLTYIGMATLYPDR